MPNLTLDNIVNVVVTTARATNIRVGLNVGLIIGKSERISTEERCKEFESLEAMAALFQASDPEYTAASMYFSQTAVPEKVVIGVCGSDEDWAEAIEDCRNKNASWYGVYCAGTLDGEAHATVAEYADGHRICYFYDSNEAAAVTDGNTDAFTYVKATGAKRAIGIYSNTAYAGAAVMGFAMGANTGAADSAYTLAYKKLKGVEVTDISEAQVTNLANKNANRYVKRGTNYKFFENGVLADGTYFDELIGLDQLAYDLQNACMDVLVSANGKVPYTDAGALQFVLACNEVCNEAVKTGFLAPGIWQGETVLTVETGDTLEAGFLCQTIPVALQSAEAKASRKAPPVYVCAILAGAIHSVVIRVDVE